MELKSLNININRIILQRNFFLLVVLIMLLVNAGLVFKLISDEKKTVIIPANLVKEIEITDSKVSVSYVEEMVAFFVPNLLSLNTSDIEFKSKIILQNTHHSFYQAMSNYYREERKKRHEYNLSTHFVMNGIEIDGAEGIARVSGTLHSNFGHNGTKEEQKQYFFKVIYVDNRLLISDFYENVAKGEGDE